MVKGPAPDGPTDGLQRLRAGRGQKASKRTTPPPQRFPRPEHESEEGKRLVRKIAAPVRILAVDDLRLLRMQHQLAGRKAVGNRAPECPRLLGAFAMTNDVVRVPLDTDV